MQQTVRAVNQVTFYSFVLLKRKAIGRVIRSIKDYGVVFLCDER